MAEVTLALVDVEDIAKVAVALLRSDDHAGKSFAMTGPQALGMTDIAEHISQAIGKANSVRCDQPEERRKTLLAIGAPRYFVDALYEQAVERLRNPNAEVHLDTHEAFGVKTTTFGEFANRCASAFQGEPAVA